jgi:hypothetical protein
VASKSSNQRINYNDQLYQIAICALDGTERYAVVYYKYCSILNRPLPDYSCLARCTDAVECTIDYLPTSRRLLRTVRMVFKQQQDGANERIKEASKHERNVEFMRRVVEKVKHTDSPYVVRICAKLG